MVMITIDSYENKSLNECYNAASMFLVFLSFCDIHFSECGLS